MQHNLIHPLRRIDGISFTPIVADCICKNITVSVKRCARDCASDLWIPLQSMLGVFIPKMEGSVTASGAEGAVYGVEADGVDGVDVADVAAVGRCLAVAFEAEV